jgi:isoprenylcysteine carboxyl methyltransferase (ICMT) family protein YpbQ
VLDIPMDTAASTSSFIQLNTVFFMKHPNVTPVTNWNGMESINTIQPSMQADWQPEYVCSQFGGFRTAKLYVMNIMCRTCKEISFEKTKHPDYCLECVHLQE